jgi:NADPH2:quinone reductase
MRAVGLFTHGGPEVLQVVELPEVHAGPGQVRIRVHAATVNPTDVAARNGARAEQQKADPPPYVPGMEVAGVVDEVGSGVPDRLEVGDTVMAIAWCRKAAMVHIASRLCWMPDRSCAPLPEGPILRPAACR